MKTTNLEVSNNTTLVETTPLVGTTTSVELTLEQEIELKIKSEREKFELKLELQREKYRQTIKQEVETRKLRQLELESKAEQLKLEATLKYEQMLVELKNKADQWLISETTRIEKMVETGHLVKSTDGLRVEPTISHVEWADSLVGLKVQFEKNGYPLKGLVKSKVVDYRVGITMIKILGEDGSFYHKAFSSKDKIVVI